MTNESSEPCPPTWRCPACSYQGQAAEDLIIHLRRVHSPKVPKASVVAWSCPLEGCPKSEVWYQNSSYLCIHLKEHVPQVVSADPARAEAAAPPPQPGASDIAPPRSRKTRRRAVAGSVEDLGIKDARAWACPACAFGAPTAGGLAAHMRHVHVTPMLEEEAPSTWRCPSKKCKAAENALTSAASFADHLNLHAFNEESGEHRRVANKCSTQGCTFPARRGARCWTHYREALRLTRARRKHGTT